MSPLLSLSGVTKRFPGVIANDDVGFSVKAGAIHALLGENGAGKSTLVKMIYGVQQPDEGVIRLNGMPFAPRSPGEARAAGVGLVFQHFSLFDALTVAENVALGLPAAQAGRDLPDRIRKVSAAYGLPLEPGRIVGELSVGARQRVEIVRCLLQSPKLLIMDEPTSVLTPQEVEILFRTLRQLRDEGVSILYISHKLEEIRALCSAATILRHGKVVGACDPRSESAKSLAEMMIGAELAAPKPRDLTPGEVRLSVRGLSAPGEGAFGVSLKDISFDLRAGEILGVAGVAGNGQDELIDALSGEIPCDHDAIRLGGAPVGRFGPDKRLRLSAAERFAEAVVKAFDVRTAGVDHAARSLSGGNLQKFVMGREIMQDPGVLIVAQPTWGVDAGAAGAIREALRDMAAKGTAVMVISQDLDELMELSTTLSVISGGAMSAPRPASDMDVETIGLMMGGADAAEIPHA